MAREPMVTDLYRFISIRSPQLLGKSKKKEDSLIFQLRK